MPIDPLLLSGIISGATGLLSGFGGLGESEQEKAMRGMLDKLYQNEDYMKSTAFTKDELFNEIFPIIKNLNLTASDVAGARLGAEVGESRANVGGGQNFVDYYMQALSPVLAQGQFASAEALQQLVQVYAQMDAQSKSRLLQLLGYEMQATQGLPDMTDFQSFITNFIQGGNIGATIGGNVNMASYYANKKFPNNDPNGGNI